MAVNDRVREIRQAVGLTQNKFAERIASSSSYLAAMELGNKKVNERIIRLIISEFKVDEHWLRTGEGNMFDAEIDERSAKINSLFKSLSPYFQDCALQQLNVLLKLNDRYRN